MWYYLEEDQQRGPIMQADLEALRKDGKIDSETMVWQEGMANWQTLREALPATAGTSNTPPSPVPPIDAGGNGVICSQCGGRFPASEVIRYGNAAVCAACKPIFVQKLKEGANVGGTMELAGIGTRFAAYFVDGIICNIITMIAYVLSLMVVGLLAGMVGGRSPVFAILAFTLVMGIVLGFNIFYYVYFIGKNGQTPGKKLCKIKVVNADGSRVSYAKAAGRYFGYMLSALILCLGFLMAAWDPEKRALHDRLCDTRVIKA